MNKDIFYNYIENPEILDEKSLKDLSELLADYPYFQAAQMLYSKNLHNINHIKYDAQLKLTSTYVYNRKKLFQLINLKPKVNILNIESNAKDSDFESTIKKEEPLENNIPEIENIIITSETIESINNSDLHQQELDVYLDADEKVTELEEQIVSEDTIAENTIVEISNIENVENIDVNLEVIENNDFENIKTDFEEINTENNNQNDLILEKNKAYDFNIIEEIELNTNEESVILEQAEKIEENIISNTEKTASNTSNIADEILQRVANLKQEFANNKPEKAESIADIILRKSAEAKNKKDSVNLETENKSQNEIVEIQPEKIYENIVESVIENPDKTLEETIIENINEAKREELINTENKQVTENIIDIIEVDEINNDLVQARDSILTVQSIDKFIIEDKDENLDSSFETKNLIELEDNICETDKQTTDSIIVSGIIAGLEITSDIPEEENTFENDTIIEIADKPDESINKNESFSFNDWFNVLQGSPIKSKEIKESENIKKVPESELIEKFIKEEPRITPIKNSNIDYNVDISKSIASESDSFITETLAKIYIKQGYYQKALNIYQKLSLKYSENNTYFAKKIEEVKNLINK